MDVLTLLAAASQNQASGTFDAGTPQSSCSLQVTVAGSPSFSVQLQGSADAIAWAAVGSPLTSAATSSLTPSPAARYFRAVLSGFTGPGSITALLGFTAGTGFTEPGGGSSGAAVAITAQSGAPSGTPSPAAGTVAAVFDTDTNQLFVFNGSWKAVTLS
jgi:hypothetical protein